MATPSAPLTAADLESTAELPVLDPAFDPELEGVQARAEADADAHHATTWVMPHAVGAAVPDPGADEMRRRLESSLQNLYARLRETQELLVAKDSRLIDLEQALQEAHAARAAAEERAVQAAADLALAHESSGHERSRLRAAHDEHRSALELEARSVRSAAAQTASAHGSELSEARAQLARATERAAHLAQALEASEASARARDNAAQAHRQALTTSERAHAATLRDLHAERQRTAEYFETLQRAEHRRAISQSVIWDLQHEHAGQEASVRRLTRELAGHEARRQERDAELARRAARIEKLEQQLRTGAAREPQTPAPQPTALQPTALQPAALQPAVQQPATPPPGHEELGRLATARADLEAALAALRAESAASLASERQRAARLESELAAVRQEMLDWGGVLKAAQQERNEQVTHSAAGAARMHELELRLQEQLDAVRVLQADSNTNAARARELEADLEAAEDTINRLEAQARGRGARLDELENANRQWRETMDEVRATSTEPGVAGSALHSAAATFTESHGSPERAPPERTSPERAAPERPLPLPEPIAAGATRLLICTEQGREVVHVLGRKTSIGRTPDNDLQIDAKFISRHHAVVLAGPTHTVIEDLNSTNGVLVNGQRVTRQTLRDGDEVVIGRAYYRFAVRRAGDH